MFYILLALFGLALFASPRYLILGLALSAAMLVRHFAFLPPKLVNVNLEGEYRVVSTNALGAVIKYQGALVNVPSIETVQKGDLIRIKGVITTPENTSEFAAATYLKSHNVNYTMDWPDVSIKQRSASIGTQIKNQINRGPADYLRVVPLLLLGERTELSQGFYDKMLALGAVHLIAISGLNLNVLSKICVRGLTMCKVTPKHALILALVPVLSYVVLLDYPVAALRAGIMLASYALSKAWAKKPLSALSRLGLALAMIMLWKPYLVFGLSFIFTFGASLIIALTSSYRWRKKWTRNVVITLLVHLWTAVVAMHVNGTYALFSLPLMILLTPFFSGLYLASVLLWPFKAAISPLCSLTLWIIDNLSLVNLSIAIPNVSLILTQALSASGLSLYIIKNVWNFFSAKSLTLLKSL